MCIMDAEGKVLASTFTENVSDFVEVKAFAQSQAESQLIKGYQYFKVSDDCHLDYILVVHGENEDTYMVGSWPHSRFRA